MIEIKARILQRAVFITGECLQCELTITNQGRTKRDSLKSDEKYIKSRQSAESVCLYEPESWTQNIPNSDKQKNIDDDSVTLAWASAQIYCHCNINERKLRLPVNLHNQKQDHITKFTSFSPVMGETGHCLCSTAASVLFCDLKLAKGESKKFLYSQKLPVDLPPSYRGQNIKLSYKVCIGIGRIGQPLCMIRLPFKLFEMKGIFKSLKDKLGGSGFVKEQEETLPEIPPEKPKRRNPFVKEEVQEKYSTLDAAMEALTGLTVKRNMNTYNIQSVNGAVGKFCLSKYYYRLGEDVLGTFDFSEGPISCIKYTVSLQIEETVTKNCLLQPSLSNLVQYITLSCHEECCCLATKTHFLLPIPITATSEFTHKIVSLRWRLHFEFIIDSTDIGNEKTLTSQDNKNEANLDIPTKFKTESMLWDLPIHVVATNPIQASLMMQADSTEIVHLPDT